jgi:ribonucleotide reductase alpha subunit
MSFNFDKLETLVGDLVNNINQVIDRNYYPDDIPEIKYSNLRHRPLGIGVQGLADVFAMLNIAWASVKGTDDASPYVVSKAARKLNDQIFETMYFAAIRASIELAKVDGWYETFPGSPASHGKFQFDMWDDEYKERKMDVSFPKELLAEEQKRRSRYTSEQWESLRRDMMKYGLRNSLLISLMPTASSAHILNNMEAMEPFTELVYARTVLSGQFLVVNKHLVRDLKSLGLWNTTTVKNIIANRGSLQKLLVPTGGDQTLADQVRWLKLKYLTVFELPQKITLQLSIDRGRYICQTQSFNCFMERPDKTKLNAFHFYGWRHGIKTGMYYLRQKALTDPINMAINSIVIPEKDKKRKREIDRVECNEEVCISCQS